MEIWWIATFPQNLALICSTVSEKTRFTDGRTTDARATALALLTRSSRAKNDHTKTIFYLDLKHVHKYGSTKFHPNSFFFSQLMAMKSAESVAGKKKVCQPIGDPARGTECPREIT